LKSIVLPTSVEVIGEGAFQKCKMVETVIFEANSAAREIGKYGFGESGLNIIVIPTSVEVIGEGAFSKCNSLASVTFEADSVVRTIGSDAFEGCPCAGGLEFPYRPGLPAAGRDKTEE
jgi:hypothetical protein